MKNFTSCFKGKSLFFFAKQNITEFNLNLKKQSHFADKKFLKFFFSRLRKNTTKVYADSFPYISLCGKERNFIRCDDLPIVFTNVIQLEDPETGEMTDYFCYGHAGNLLKVSFFPNLL